MQHQASAPLAGQSYEAAVWDLNQLQSTYQIIEQIKASGGRLNEYSISEFEAFLEKTGHQVDDLNSLNVIHVTGTKGKGSTCAFVNSILDKLSSVHEKRTQKPLKIGLYTSPHLIEVRERIQINGQPIAQEDFAKYFYQVYDSLKSKEPPLRKITAESPEMPMYFRFLTLLAYHTFLMEGVDVAIIEVGVGGQYDSTNAIRKPVVCGIASLGIDHQASLGTTIESIAWHKAGIIKDGVPVFTVDQLPSALAVIQKRAEERNAPMHVVHPLGVQNGQLDNIELGISGEHQRVNAALAAALCREWVRQTDFLDVDAGELDEAISAGLKAAHWPGRSQTFVSPRIPSLTWHVDGAHTVESMAACAKWFLQLRLSGSRCVLLFNAAHNRSANILLDTLSRDADGFCEAVFCPNISSRADSVNHTVQNDMELRPQKDAAQAWSQLTKVPNSKTTIMPSINDAVAHIEATYGDGAPVHVLATGSLHLVGGVLDFAKGSI
ncbi:Folylpolyglutamate synthetase [Coemansia spiralis]|uniref:Folylpolyglutamate synthase n=2 Tax=Coemansia TaxID=4863 RepID=A0A9W8KZ48_9FUNG|nr:Folylpolyglutamate synthetase [Coemansia umbellata]KAJ2622698.1 Folylpolyglutamate synthetase [Coemansia sp. RSA 1358]KAJ2679089.1 Folylpolyglutamate synthetase [Coemansia spiralis]